MNYSKQKAVMERCNHEFSNNGKRIGIFVIAYNAESHIENTLSRIPEEIWKAVTVVYIIDDCSTDETVHKTVLFQNSRDKVVILRNRVNQMYGGNQKLGYQYAIDHDLDVVVMLHADGQYAPEHLRYLLGPIVRNDADVVLGSRMIERRTALKGGMPLYKFLGNIVLTKIENALCSMNLSEFHSGYRAYSTSALKNIPFWENTDSWHFDTEILLQAKECGCRIFEVPIPTFYGDEICRVNGTLYGLNCILVSLKYYFFRKGLFYGRIFDVERRGLSYCGKSNDPFSSHSEIHKRLKSENLGGKKVLELRGDISLTKSMFEMGAVVDGIEINPFLSERARPYCRKVYEMDLMDIEKIGLNEQYDIIVAADILEHLEDPEAILSSLKKYLKIKGLLIISLPNVVNIYVRLNVLFGRFPYHSKGILNKSHLRFYTFASAKKMLVKTGWYVVKSDVTCLPVGILFPFLLKSPSKYILTLLHWFTRLFRGLLAYQNIFYCQNPNSPKLL